MNFLKGSIFYMELRNAVIRRFLWLLNIILDFLTSGSFCYRRGYVELKEQTVRVFH